MSRPIILVHGGWHGGWCFEKVVGPLRDMGLTVSAPDLPLQGIQGDIATVRAELKRHPNAVLLGHSFGGVVVTHAAAGTDVSRLVYLCALMPGMGEDIRQVLADAPKSPLNDVRVIDEAEGTLYVKPEGRVNALYHDCDPKEAAAFAERMRPQKYDSVMPIISEAPAWSVVPTTYVVCIEDRALHVDIQRTFAKRASSVAEWPTSHSPFTSQPELVISLLAKLATEGK